MQIAVYGNALKDVDIPYVQQLFDSLSERNVKVFVYAPYLESLEGKVNFGGETGVYHDFADFWPHHFDFVITLGGDGTILSAVTLIRDSEVPILGINLGRLGFLATVNKNNIREAIQQLELGHYLVSSRRVLQLEADPPLFGEIPFALNDFSILRRNTSSMITIRTYLDGHYLNTYWADGIILATPTGSTGYSLSCGGPIVFPDSNNFVLTPVAPHNLNMRPLVIPDSSVISFEVSGREEHYLCTLDSRQDMITEKNKLVVRRGNFVVNLVQLGDDGFLETIRNKLAWGIDLRNY